MDKDLYILPDRENNREQRKANTQNTQAWLDCLQTMAIDKQHE